MDKFIKIIYKICAVIFTLAVFLATGFIAIMIPANSPSFYKEQFYKIDYFGNPVIETVRLQARLIEDKKASKYIANISEEQLLDLMMHTMKYLTFLEDDLNITVDGEYLEIYRSDELSHMQDVKNLFGGGIILVLVATVILCVLLVLGLIKKKGYYENCRKVPYYTLIGIFAVLALLGLAIAIDFTTAFEIFHQIFFDGNYAFADGVMIAMINNIFFDLVPIILAIWIVLLALFVVGLVLYNYVLKQKFTQSE